VLLAICAVDVVSVFFLRVAAGRRVERIEKESVRPVTAPRGGLQQVCWSNLGRLLCRGCFGVVVSLTTLCRCVQRSQSETAIRHGALRCLTVVTLKERASECERKRERERERDV
jgi:hypothetical protein